MKQEKLSLNKLLLRQMESQWLERLFRRRDNQRCDRRLVKQGNQKLEKLSHRLGEEGWMLIWGEKRGLDNFIKKIKKMIKI